MGVLPIDPLKGLVGLAAGTIPRAHELRVEKTRACRQAGLTALQNVRGRLGGFSLVGSGRGCGCALMVILARFGP